MNQVLEKFNVEVAFATPEKQIIICVSIPHNMAITEVIKLSKIEAEFPKYHDLFNSPIPHIGIFGKKIDINTYQLKPNDRIEIYRPLNKTPNQKRLERAKNIENK